jgi:hypothetical protein
VRALVLLLIPAVAAAEPPTPVVTKAFMRAIAAGKVPTADLVDPDIGIVVIDYVTDEQEPVTKSARRLCGAAAEAHIKYWVKNHLKPSLAMDELFSCTNRPRPTCTAGIGGELMTKTEYEFRPLPDGTLVLDTLVTTDSTYVAKDKPQVVARLRAKLIGGRCP